MNDMGESNFVLGVKITRDHSNKLLSLSQRTYIKKILEGFHMHNSKPIDIPREKGCTLSLDQHLKNDEEKKKSNVESTLCICNQEFDVRSAMFASRHMFCSWHG